MSLLKEVLAFDAERSNYTIEEQKMLEKSFRIRVAKVLRGTKNALINAIDDVNDA